MIRGLLGVASNPFYVKYLNYILIVVGAIVALYAKVDEDQNQFILIGGIMILMIGIYRISRKIPSKSADELNENENHDI
ncbi:hypothetical protein [Changchengzhania lutea]|uniref:hypothetical protein n=1 Tax=Changchengzhania lutea TaxID=2049305 RepID=UPI001FE59612|nr:hypothetical protein [Changchengzhania lutea]